jgi:hypothetical protein
VATNAETTPQPRFAGLARGCDDPELDAPGTPMAPSPSAMRAPSTSGNLLIVVGSKSMRMISAAR